nr:rho GTPase-activating protein 12-like [Oncorhynchus nerka]
MAMVQVQFEYEYTAKDGALVSIKPNERYILVSRTNDYWWHVRKDQRTKPFYIPAKYVTELSVKTQGPLDLTNSGTQSRTFLQSTTDREPLDMSNKGQWSGAVTKVCMSTDHSARATTLRMSTFGVSLDIDDIKHYEHMKTMVGLQTSNNETRDIPPHDLKRRSLAPGFSFTSASDAQGLGDMLQHCSLKLHVSPEPTSRLPQLQSSPPTLIKDQDKQLISGGRITKTLPGDPSGLSHLSQDSDIYETISDTQHSELTDFVGTELAGSLGSTETPAEQQQSLDRTSGPLDITAPSPTAQVKESVQNAVYVNVAELGRNISESPPSAFSPPCTPPYLDSKGWEVHTDQESGREYYYHPESGQTTWDNPHIDPEAPAEVSVCSPSSQFPSLSPTSASPPAWTSDWEQCLDVTSGHQYFYNPVSGETSWESPEPQCPYPALMEPLSGLRSLEEGPPPLPEEDYQADDYQADDYQADDYPADNYLAEVDLPEEELLAVSPVTPHSFPKDYTPSHVTRAVIPRASLDRSAPTGWNLNIDPDGTWVFSNRHSPDQWIKSLDDRGLTYYYLRDGSRSQWNLPEAPVVSGQSKVGNGVELDGVMKNWRHTMGATYVSSALQEVVRTNNTYWSINIPHVPKHRAHHSRAMR